MLLVEIPTVGPRQLSRSHVFELYGNCARALEQSLPDEGTAWRDDPARARTSGVMETAKLAKNKRRKK
jgi:hypothetical protein